MPSGDVLKAQLAKAKAGGGAPKLTFHFAGEDEEEFRLNDWNVTVWDGLPAPDYVVVQLDKDDGSQSVIILMANVTFYRIES